MFLKVPFFATINISLCLTEYWYSFIMLIRTEMLPRVLSFCLSQNVVGVHSLPFFSVNSLPMYFWPGKHLVVWTANCK